MTLKAIYSDSNQARNVNSALLRKFADLIEKTPTADVDALLNGSKELRILKARSRNRASAPKEMSSSPASDTLHLELVRQLNELKSRELGIDLLQRKLKSKVEIERFARYLDLPVLRSDTGRTLCEKIVESEIGSRLRSEAVQGKVTL